jgi:hypothetical protein
LLRQRVIEQLRRMQRLHQVMADRRQKPALALVGALRGAAGGFELNGTRAHSLLQGFVGTAQSLFGTPESGDIGKGGDKTSTRHRVAANFHDGTIGKLAFGQVRGTGAHMRQPPLYFFVYRLCNVRVSIQRKRRQIGNRPPNLQQFCRESKQLDIAPIPSHQTQIAINHTDALAHVFQRSLQHLLIEAQRLRRLTNDGNDGIQIASGFAPRCIKQQSRRRSAKHRRQLAFNCGNKLDIRRRAGVKQGMHALTRQQARGNIAQLRLGQTQS